MSFAIEKFYLLFQGTLVFQGLFGLFGEGVNALAGHVELFWILVEDEVHGAEFDDEHRRGANGDHEQRGGAARHRGLGATTGSIVSACRRTPGRS